VRQGILFHQEFTGDQNSIDTSEFTTIGAVDVACPGDLVPSLNRPSSSSVVNVRAQNKGRGCKVGTVVESAIGTRNRSAREKAFREERA
jgi:hypothetical protein